MASTLFSGKSRAIAIFLVSLFLGVSENNAEARPVYEFTGPDEPAWKMEHTFIRSDELSTSSLNTDIHPNIHSTETTLYTSALASMKSGLKGLHVDGLISRIEKTSASDGRIAATKNNGTLTPLGLLVESIPEGDGTFLDGQPKQEAVIVFNRYDMDMEMISGEFIISRNDKGKTEHCFNPMGIGTQGIQDENSLRIPFSVRRQGSANIDTNKIHCVPGNLFFDVEWDVISP